MLKKPGRDLHLFFYNMVNSDVVCGITQQIGSGSFFQRSLHLYIHPVITSYEGLFRETSMVGVNSDVIKTNGIQCANYRAKVTQKHINLVGTATITEALEEVNTQGDHMRSGTKAQDLI